MCLAQLSIGNESVEFYKKGIELMIVEYEKQTSSSSSAPAKPTTSKAAKFTDSDDEDEEEFGKVKTTDISTAFGSIAEIYLTDLW